MTNAEHLEHIVNIEESPQSEALFNSDDNGQLRLAVASELARLTLLDTLFDGYPEPEDNGQTEPQNEQPQNIHTEFTDLIKSLKKRANIMANEKVTPRSANANTGKASRTQSSSGTDLLKDYLNEIGKFPLLDKDEEVLLARCIEAGLDVGQNPDDDGIHALQEAKEAKQLFIKSNLRLVVRWAKKYQYSTQNMTLLDLIQEGNMGMEHAVDKFKWEQGYKFSTYASWWIRQAIVRGIANSDKQIRLSVDMHDRVRDYSRVVHSLEDSANGNAKPSDREICERMGIPLKKLKQIKDAERIQAVVSLDRPFNDGDDNAPCLADVVSSPAESSDIDNMISNLVDREKVNRFMDCLTPEEKLVITCRYGLDTGVPKTIIETGKSLAINETKVKRTEIVALRKMKNQAGEQQFED